MRGVCSHEVPDAVFLTALPKGLSASSVASTRLPAEGQAGPAGASSEGPLCVSPSSERTLVSGAAQAAGEERADTNSFDRSSCRVVVGAVDWSLDSRLPRPFLLLVVRASFRCPPSPQCRHSATDCWGRSFHLGTLPHSGHTGHIAVGNVGGRSLYNRLAVLGPAAVVAPNEVLVSESMLSFVLPPLTAGTLHLGGLPSRGALTRSE